MGAGTGYLGRELGNILSIVLDTLGDHLAKELGTELRSTEDMLLISIISIEGRAWRTL